MPIERPLVQQPQRRSWLTHPHCSEDGKLPPPLSSVPGRLCAACLLLGICRAAFSSVPQSSPSSLSWYSAMGFGNKSQGQCPVSCCFTLMRYTWCNPAMESALQREVIAGCHEQSSSGNWFIYLEAVVAISAQTE